MLILSAKFSRKNRIITCILVIALVLLILIFSFLFKKQPKAGAAQRYAPHNEQRIAFLQSYGWTVEQQPIETLNLPMGDTLEEPFLSYNELQRKQGFDLTACCNKTLQRYSYQVTNYPGRTDCQANLYLCGNQIVAGDIVCLGDNGFMKDLQFPRGKIE